MSKKHKSIFESSTPQEIKKDVLQVQKQSIQSEKQNENSVSPSNTSSEERPKHLYVSPSVHQQTKIQASIRGMKLREYIEWLIEKDKSQIKF